MEELWDKNERLVHLCVLPTFSGAHLMIFLVCKNIFEKV
jgi:hypothetical protein